MYLRVHHETSYHYDAPVTAASQILRLSPRSHDGQNVIGWQVRATGRRELPSFIDGFGNLVHCHAVNHPHDFSIILAAGAVRTAETQGIVRGAAEPLPPLFFLRPTSLTRPDAALTAFAADLTRHGAPLAVLHALMQAVHQQLPYRIGVTGAATTAAEALALGAGVCQDHAHVFITASRVLGIPARYIGGYLWTGSETMTSEAGHAWAEAFVPDLGWVGFDPSNQTCVTAAHIRVSVGLDYLSAAPSRGVRQGVAGETLAVEVRVTDDATRLDGATQ